ncbi:MAG: hypothetical protein HQL46_15995, partial [Gammaproteobacteria bacterium]|nr:hypothetical protein [Gammaproteobacteria bacterium]
MLSRLKRLLRFFVLTILLIVLSLIVLEPLRIIAVSIIAHQMIGKVDKDLSIQQLDIERFKWNELLIKSLILKDRHQQWLSIKNFHLEFQLSELFNQQLFIQQFNIEHLSLQYLPQWIELSSSAKSEEKNSEEVSELPIQIKINQINLNKIKIKQQAFKQLQRQYQFQSLIDKEFHQPWQQLHFSLNADADIQSLDDIKANILVSTLTPDSTADKRVILQLNLDQSKNETVLEFKFQINRLFHQMISSSEITLNGDIKKSKDIIHLNANSKISKLFVNNLKQTIKKPQDFNVSTSADLEKQKLSVKEFNINSSWFKNILQGEINID